jgi:RNA polymerase sigma factor (sigma-70 family)
MGGLPGKRLPGARCPACSGRGKVDKATWDARAAAVGELIERLPDREKLVLSLYYYDHLTMREIGEVLGVTDIRVSQLLAQVIKRLRDAGA